MKKIIIGIIGRNIQNNNKNFIGIYENYIKKIKENGGIPIIITKDNTVFLKQCNGILSPGGDDITPFDKYIYNYALKNDIPYLGICLGMQVMSNNLSKVKNHNHVNHEVYLNPNSKLYNIYQKNKIVVNSRHTYKVAYTNNIIAAISYDGIIEAIEIKNKKFIIGVQWHPEDLCDNKLFEYFIKTCL